MFTFIFVYQLWHFHSNFINVYSKVSNLQWILVPIMTFLWNRRKEQTIHHMPILTSACATRPWWVNEWLVIDVGEIFSFLLINNKLGVPGVASYRRHGISLAFINLFNQPTKFCGHLHLPRWRIFHQVWCTTPDDATLISMASACRVMTECTSHMNAIQMWCQTICIQSDV